MKFFDNIKAVYTYISNRGNEGFKNNFYENMEEDKGESFLERVNNALAEAKAEENDPEAQAASKRSARETLDNMRDENEPKKAAEAASYEKLSFWGKVKDFLGIKTESHDHTSLFERAKSGELDADGVYNKFQQDGNITGEQRRGACIELMCKAGKFNSVETAGKFYDDKTQRLDNFQADLQASVQNKDLECCLEAIKGIAEERGIKGDNLIRGEAMGIIMQNFGKTEQEAVELLTNPIQSQNTTPKKGDLGQIKMNNLDVMKEFDRTSGELLAETKDIQLSTSAPVVNMNAGKSANALAA